MTLLRLAAEGKEITIVNDQYGSPTWCRYIAEVTAQVILSGSLIENSGFYNLSSEGKTTWYDFAKEIYSLAEINIKIRTYPYE